MKKTIRRLFQEYQKRNPGKSSYLCFAEAISGRGFSRQKIRRNFKKLVDGDDYAQNDSKNILDYLFTL